MLYMYINSYRSTLYYMYDTLVFMAFAKYKIESYSYIE
jgi:hypothetical protein